MSTAVHYSPMTAIKLSGPLAKRFGRFHRRLLDGGSVKEVFAALKATIPGFAEEVRRLDMLGMRFAIFRNRKNIGVDELDLGGANEVRIVPVVSGSKRAGLLQTIIGAVIFVASFIVPGMQGWGNRLVRRWLLAGNPDAQPAGFRFEAECIPREFALLRIRQRKEHNCQRQPGTDMHW